MTKRSKTRIHKATAQMIVPQDDDAARAMIAKLGQIDRNLAEVGELIRARIEGARADFKAITDVANGEAKLIHAALQAYFEANADRLTDGGKRRTVDWPEGRMGHRLSKPKLKLLAEEDSIIDVIDRLGLDGLLRVDVQLEKPAITNILKGGTDFAAEHVAVLAALMSIEQREEFFAAAHDVATATTIDHGETNNG